MIKLFAMDLDGTTLDNNSNLDKKIIKGLEKLENNGIKFVFTSGRAKPSVDYLTSLTGYDNPSVANNGAIASIKADKVIYENFLTYKDIEKLISYCEENKLLYQFYDVDTYYSNRVNPERFNHLKKSSEYGMNYQINFSFSNNPLNDLKLRNRNALKFQIFPTKENKLKREDVMDDVSNLNKNLYITSSNSDIIEIMQKNVDKFTAVCEVADFLGINKNEIAAIGDQDNDIPMLKGSKLSFSLENGIDKAKKVADYVVSSNDKFGLLEAIDIVIKENSYV